MKRAIELFCCAGGMAEGFRRAGIEFALAFDKSDDACESYARNLGHRPIQVDVREVPRLLRAGWGPEHLDLLVADPPCTPWSRAGKRKGLDDERDMLRETVEIIRLARPVAFLIGNVPGLDDAANIGAVQSTIGTLWGDGYCVDFARLDAADYGVPQHRVRPFWFGHPKGSACLRWPAPTHGDPSSPPALPGLALKPWISCREALEHLAPDELGQPVRVRWKDGSDHRMSEVDQPAKTLMRNTHSDGALLAHQRHPISAHHEPSRAITSSDGGGAKGSRVVSWPWPAPSTTITADPNGRLAPPGHHGKSFLSGPNAIKLTEKAAAILQGFPESWHFAGKTKRARWSQIGQAMPPALAAAVASGIVAWFRAERFPAAAVRKFQELAPEAFADFDGGCS